MHNVSKRILVHYNAGDTKPFESRHYQHPNFVLPITLPAQSDLAFYFSIRTEGSMTAGATLWHPDVFSEQSRIDYFYINLYISLLAALICYNFLLFITIREISYGAVPDNT